MITKKLSFKVPVTTRRTEKTIADNGKKVFIHLFRGKISNNSETIPKSDAIQDSFVFESTSVISFRKHKKTMQEDEMMKVSPIYGAVYNRLKSNENFINENDELK